MPRLVRCLLGGKDYQKFCAFPDFAAYLNSAAMFLGDPAGQ
jgi:hypothetical protein